MHFISPHIVQVFDDPHAEHRRVKRAGNRLRFESKGRVPRRQRNDPPSSGQ
jgi:hypothetical protein